jgi:hypothetical protein
MTIETPDFQRLVTEMILKLGPEATEEWLQEADISDEAFDFLIHRLLTTLMVCVEEEGFDPPIALAATVATSFQMGWEAHKQYGHAKS